MHVIGRDEEIKLLEDLYRSKKSEFLALHGRRRIGKTYLIRKFFEKKKGFFLQVTGSKNGTMAEQIAHFTEELSHTFYKGITLQPAKNWDAAFKALTQAIQHQVPKQEKIILFFDELPWMAGRNARVLEALDYYWNQHWSRDKRIKLIVCGSSASWIINKIINNKGGLHNRITRQLVLEPFNLLQTKKFLESKKIRLNHRQILQLFMVTGGVPYYLSQIEKGKSATETIEKLAFSKQAFLLNEFNNLFSSLFEDSDDYIRIVKILAENRYGVGERTLLTKLGKHSIGGTGKKKLAELEQTGFIMRFQPLYNKSRHTYYRLVDEYTLFYLRWIEPLHASLQKRALALGNWQALQTTPEWYSWLGYAFEAVCYKHLAQIRKALKLNPTAIVGAWRYVPQKKSKVRGAQIDLLFDRKDDAVTICEIKYSEKPYVLTKDSVEDLQRKLAVFKARTRTKKQLFIAMITAQGLKNNYYAEDLISGVVTLEDLFSM